MMKNIDKPVLKSCIVSFSLVITLYLSVGPARAEPTHSPTEETPELIGDRPDFTESSQTIPASHLQIEMGVDFSTLGSDPALTLPATLLRWGVVDHFELRLGLPSYEVAFVEAADGQSNADHDIGGVEIGAKIAFNVTDRFALGALPFFVLPLYAEPWDTVGMEMGIKGLWAVDLNDTFSLGGNVGVIVGGLGADGDEVPIDTLASLSLGIGLTAELGMFVEIYSFMDRDFEFTPVADGGITYLVTPRFQLDIYAGVGLSEASRGFNTGFGAIILI